MDMLDRKKGKNYFINLWFHKKDFMLIFWNFFATSHGKLAFNGIGGAAKRLATKVSLQRPIDDQGLNATDMHKFSSYNIKGICFCIVNGKMYCKWQNNE